MAPTMPNSNFKAQVWLMPHRGGNYVLQSVNQSPKAPNGSQGGAAAMPTAVGGGTGIFGGGGMDPVQQEVNNVLKSEHAQASASGVSTEEVRLSTCPPLLSRG